MAVLIAPTENIDATQAQKKAAITTSVKLAADSSFKLVIGLKRRLALNEAFQERI
jgi:hypothetical protein